MTKQSAPQMQWLLAALGPPSEPIPPSESEVEHREPTVTPLDREGRVPSSALVMAEAPAAQSSMCLVLREAFPALHLVVADFSRGTGYILRSRSIDLALIDLSAPGTVGVEAIQEIGRISPSTQCIAVADIDSADQIFAALTVGVKGYLLRDQPRHVIIEQLRLLPQGIQPFSPAVAERVVQHFANTGRIQPTKKERLVPLSVREREVLTLIAKGLAVAEVAATLHISDHTVSSHIKSIYRKRQLSGRAEAALEAKRLGLV